MKKKALVATSLILLSALLALPGAAADPDADGTAEVAPESSGTCKVVEAQTTEQTVGVPGVFTLVVHSRHICV